ncbi:uncharacterized protein SAPINGB_P002598 [Magnusiomyces paraingens]|uniref:Phosphoribosylglycinamide formyltransferase n=1 Tax=Magnusiomyces paraingens TaxID=2606893 RepID=A0A5E8BES1_9ASCO|nr:uncharacterized protein SAPINGB_P002598 [Saprochaete ingens]VVT50095.1 unnamed protein product [Saprochaete ingens]
MSTESPQKNIVVLISGSGTNLQALIDAAAANKLGGAKIQQVISSSASAYGLTRAANGNVPSYVHTLQCDKYYGKLAKDDRAARKAARLQFNRDLATHILELSPRPDLIVCAGWMLILAPEFLGPVEEEAGISIINLHPALPGAFAGTHAIQRAWEAGQKGEITKGGVMIHKVIAAVDEGEPLIVKEIELKKDETVEEYEDRVHAVEHEAIVEGTIKALE